jgi:hypothetical protein
LAVIFFYLDQRRGSRVLCESECGTDNSPKCANLTFAKRSVHGLCIRTDDDDDNDDGVFCGTMHTAHSIFFSFLVINLFQFILILKLLTVLLN